MTSSSSHSPFARGSNRSARSSQVSRRVFTRSPFQAPPIEMPQVADHGGSFVSRPVNLLPDLEPRRERSRPAPTPVAHRAYATTLHRRDRSLYNWFESVGFLLGLLSVSGACVALVLR